MADTARITVTLPSEQVTEPRKLTDNVPGHVAEAVARQPRHQLLLADLPRHQERVPSRVEVEPVTEGAARGAAELLEAAGPHGHTYATVTGTAPRRAGPVAVPASDVDGMSRLYGDRVRLVGVRADPLIRGAWRPHGGFAPTGRSPYRSCNRDRRAA
ncbi:hypothetical protein ACFYOV_03320 [Streptomyces sp. NPDC005931]|uniref:hypothetical protein n=1 Tax=Streptomyces sp. NPDC005931 TaxID=3364737 RepID=UPI00367C097B